jgi:hypothetical protein
LKKLILTHLCDRHLDHDRVRDDGHDCGREFHVRDREFHVRDRDDDADHDRMLNEMQK